MRLWPVGRARDRCERARHRHRRVQSAAGLRPGGQRSGRARSEVHGVVCGVRAPRDPRLAVHRAPPAALEARSPLTPRIKALVFDFDGLILETEMPAYQSWTEIYREHGHELPR